MLYLCSFFNVLNSTSVCVCTCKHSVCCLCVCEARGKSFRQPLTTAAHDASVSGCFVRRGMARGLGKPYKVWSNYTLEPDRCPCLKLRSFRCPLGPPSEALCAAADWRWTRLSGVQAAFLSEMEVIMKNQGDKIVIEEGKLKLYMITSTKSAHYSCTTSGDKVPSIFSQQTNGA